MSRSWVLMDNGEPVGIYTTASIAMAAKSSIIEKKEPLVKKGVLSYKEIFAVRLIMFEVNELPSSIVSEYRPKRKP